MTINSSNNNPSQLKHALTSILKEWEKEASSEENRREATNRILDFFNCKEKSLLDLSYLNLSSLPDVFSHLSELEELNLNGNRLTTFPGTNIGLTALKLKIIHINNKIFATLFGILTYRAVLAQKQQLDHVLNQWIEKSLSEENQIEVKKRVFDFFNNSTKKNLNLSNLNLSSLPDIFNISCFCHRLKQLDLSKNQLTTLPDTFGNLSQLTELDLSTNQLTTLPDTFGNLAQLIWLDLNTNQLTTLPDTLGNLARLAELDLSTNQLTTLPDTFSNLAQLTQLGLSINKLTTLPDAFSSLSQLAILDLSTNQLTNLPDTLGNLSRLTELDLSINQLTTLPDTFGNLTQLIWLDLSTNQLTALPDAFSSLSQLAILDLSTNQLRTLPDTLDNLSRLTELDLSTNQLTTLPDTLDNLSRLTELNLKENQLTALPDTFSNLSKLTILNLSENQLTILPDTFGNLSRLIELDLSTNQLTTLPDTFGNLAQLTQLGLSTNKLTTLPDAFGNLSRLKILELSNNYSLTEIPLKILELPESSVIALRGNHNIDPVILEYLLTAIASFRYKGPKIILHNTMKEFVAMMYQLIKKPPREFSKLEESEDLYLWLKRLFDIADFKKGGELQKELITQVINYLTEANDNQEFRATFDTIIHDAVRTCGDRMALSIINLDVAHQLATVSFTNMHALADLLKGLWAINMLEAIAENKISVLRSEAEDPDQEVDEVEIYLGYLIKLKEDLNLPVNMQNMLFFDCSQLTPDDLQEAKAFVLSQQSHQKAYFAFLNLHDKWIAALSTHYKEEYQSIVDARENSASLENPDYIAIEENFNKQLEALTEKALSRKRALLRDSSLNESKRVRFNIL
ncbi:leucine-rich repeat domain-containing protein [Candidatus Rhabdochlamydia porcellionis]|uniref:Leucine rich repeat n=1 Tax=Candidatus Rhabdochlamydia porcellionis TaxID=225148 RepID=A0ABX8Z1I6_9BACT|nr:leucine-rich repeat domain-containing protein [Candidatus Rhabdochlamydia porcellionis]QZA58427.1 Leucine rich repeat [Candidatus Rhabdochlamydia porcellionis]